MKTRTEALEEIRRKSDRDITEANTRYDIYDKVLTPELDGYATPAVHIHRLWGTIAGIRWEVQTGKGGKAPDRNLLQTLLAIYKPEPLVYVKDGSASFRPDAQVTSGTVIQAHPVTVAFESLPCVNRIPREVRVMFQWNAYLGSDLCRFSVVYPDALVQRNPLKGARVIRWAGTETETLWWELGSIVPDFPALIAPESPAVTQRRA